MSAILVLGFIGVAVWKLWGPGMTWVTGFTTLLERPVARTGWLPFVTGLETAGGDFDGRPVLLALHHKRGRNSLGYLVVAMQPRTASAVSADALSTLTADARAALEELEGRLELHVSLEDGWLKARWQPRGFMIFPGRFDPRIWRQVLRALSVVAGSLELARA